MTGHRDHPAGDVRGLQRWISEWANATSETQARVQRRIALVAVAAMLGSGPDDHTEPLFVIKGGSALELRYGSKARASRDIDVEFRGLVGDIYRAVTELIDAGWSGFSGRVLDPQPLSIPWADVTGSRMDVRLTYLDRPFANVPLEIVTGLHQKLNSCHHSVLTVSAYRARTRSHACRSPIRSPRNFTPVQIDSMVCGRTTGSAT